MSEACLLIILDETPRRLHVVACFGTDMRETSAETEGIAHRPGAVSGRHETRIKSNADKGRTRLVPRLTLSTA